MIGIQAPQLCLTTNVSVQDGHQHCMRRTTYIRNFQAKVERNTYVFLNTQTGTLYKNEEDYSTFMQDDVKLFNSLGFEKDGIPRLSTPLLPWTSPQDQRKLPLMIYLPGFDGTGFSAHRQFPNLMKYFDLKCLTTPPQDRSTFQDLISIVKEYLVFEALDSPSDRPIYLLGESFGGLLAMAVTIECRDIVDRLIVVNPTSKFSIDQWNQMRLFLALMPDNIAPFLPIAMMPFLANPSSLPIPIQIINPFDFAKNMSRFQDFVKQAVDVSNSVGEHLPVDTVLWKLECLRHGCNYFEVQGYQNIQQRTLIITAQQDRLIPSKEEGERLLRLLPRARNICIPNKGHMILAAHDTDLFKIVKDAGFYVSERRMSSYPANNSRQGNCFGQPGPIEILSTQNLLKDPLYPLMELFFRVASPVFLSTDIHESTTQGLPNLPNGKKFLLVGNQQIVGMDIAFIARQFFLEKGILPRGMSHPVLFQNNTGIMKQLELLFTQCGDVPCSQQNMIKLFQIGESVILSPTGINEDFQGEATLKRPLENEFVRMAAQFEVTIIPFACIKADNSFEKAITVEQLFKMPIVREVFHKSTAALSPQFRTSNIMQSPISPSRFYVKFGAPVETKKEWIDNKQQCDEMYERIQGDVEGGLQYLQNKSQFDPYKDITSRLLFEASRGFQQQAPTFTP